MRPTPKLNNEAYVGGAPAFHECSLVAREMVAQVTTAATMDVSTTVGLWWLFARLDVRGWLDGLRVGSAVGLFTWGALVIGLWSISTAPVPLLLGWWAGQGIELGLAGGVLGSARAGTRLSRVWLLVCAAVVILFAAVVALQTLGIVPTVRAT